MFELDQVEMSRGTNQTSRGGGFKMLKAERPIPKRGVRQSVQGFLNRFFLLISFAAVSRYANTRQN